MIQSPYLYQTDEWEKFWLQTKDSHHQCFELHVIDSKISLRGNVFLYPWHFGQKIIHIPSGPYIHTIEDTATSQDIQLALFEFLRKVADIGKKHEVLAAKLDLDAEIGFRLGLPDQQSLLHLLQKLPQSREIGLPVLGNGRFMFPNIAYLNITDILPVHSNSSEDLLTTLQHFFETNSNYWLSKSETTRKQTRRSLKETWTLDIKKTDDCYLEIYSILEDTATRQQFTIPPFEYFEKLIDQDFCHILVLRDHDGRAVGFWLGLHYNHTLTNLYGGNFTEALKGFGPNLMQLYGLYKAKMLNCTYYDMGGYDPETGTAKFKDGYKPETQFFPGNIDIVYLPWYYRILEFGAKGKRLLKR